MNVLHIALWVSDLDATRGYYVDTLGLAHTREFEGDDGITNFFVAGTDGIELQFKHDPDRVGSVTPSGIDHLTFEVDDVDAAVERVTDAWDVEVLQAPEAMGGGTERVAFVTDPDGYAVELIEFTD